VIPTCFPLCSQFYSEVPRPPAQRTPRQDADDLPIDVAAGRPVLVEGLAAPYDEEHTSNVVKVQKVEGRSILQFWFEPANQDHFAPLTVEYEQFRKSAPPS
jgi:hypothetical protein